MRSADVTPSQFSNSAFSPDWAQRNPGAANRSLGRSKEEDAMPGSSLIEPGHDDQTD
jgi:hypothetical protein